MSLSRRNRPKPKSIATSYKLYKTLYEPVVDSKEYSNICCLYHKFLISKVLDGEEVTLPERMGTLSIMGKKQEVKFDENGQIQGLAPDWKRTKELWARDEKAKENKQLVFLMNEHTSNIRYKYHWSKVRVLATNKTIYSLRITRTNKRMASRYIKSGSEYLTIK